MVSISNLQLHAIILTNHTSRITKNVMSNKSIGLPDNLHKYLLSVSLREPEVLRQLREETAVLPHHNMQIAPEQGQFMAFLIRLMAARRTLEVGVFTGYSSLAVALALLRKL